jgi:hypothetical protein
MPTYRRVRMPGSWTISIHPDHWWRNYWFYFTGSDIRLRVYIQNLRAGCIYDRYFWQLQRWNGKKFDIIEEYRNDLNIDSNWQEIKIQSSFGYVAGKYIVYMGFRWRQNDEEMEFEIPMSTFVIFEKDASLLRIYEIVISAAIGAIVGALITLTNMPK